MSRTQLVVSLTRAAPALMEQIVAAHDAGADLVELRVDAIGDIAAIEAVLRAPRVLPIIVTIRPSAEGGLWDGDDAERISLFERLGLLQPGFMDIEAATWNRSANIRQKIGLVCEPPCATNASSGRATSTERARNKLIISHHDFRHTPPNVAETIQPLLSVGAPILKAAFMTHDATDALRLLSAQLTVGIRAAGGYTTAIMGMGEAGLVTRVLGPQFGAALVYAASSDDATAAPGQPTLSTLCDLYSWTRINERTSFYGVVGWPVSHSRSPLIHNAAMRHAGINAVYVPLPVRPEYEAFAAFMDLATDSEWLDCGGLSVTIPHKEHALRWLFERGHEVAPLASRIGAVNTLSRTAAGWRGDNTDAIGAMHALETGGAFPNGPRDLPVAILGAGGVARAVVATLAEHGCRVVIFNRDEARARSLASDFGCEHRPWPDRIATTASLIINCTSIGMTPAIDQSPLPTDAVHSGQTVFDTIYIPIETRLLREAQDRGARTISGVEMFLAQAAAQFRIWRGRGDVGDVMRTAFSSLSPS